MLDLRALAALLLKGFINFECMAFVWVQSKIWNGFRELYTANLQLKGIFKISKWNQLLWRQTNQAYTLWNFRPRQRDYLGSFIKRSVNNCDLWDYFNKVLNYVMVYRFGHGKQIFWMKTNSNEATFQKPRRKWDILTSYSQDIVTNQSILRRRCVTKVLLKYFGSYPHFLTEMRGWKLKTVIVLLRWSGTLHEISSFYAQCLYSSLIGDNWKRSTERSNTLRCQQI